MTNKIIFFVFLLLATACTKELDDKTIDENENAQIGEVPVIELLSISTTSIKAYTDSITFKITYLDGDGDLGTSDPDVYSIELIDNRDSDLFVFQYHLSPRTPEGSELTIQGELDIVLDNTILLDENNESETTTFSIRLQDRAPGTGVMWWRRKRLWWGSSLQTIQPLPNHLPIPFLFYNTRLCHTFRTIHNWATLACYIYFRKWDGGIIPKGNLLL